MGIVNITPDSFYADSRFWDKSKLADHIRKIVDLGVDIIDVGALSTRPGYTEVSAEEEKDRLSGALEIVRSHAPDTLVSVDTYRSEIAEMAVRDFQCNIINDISGAESDKAIAEVAAQYRVPYVLTYNRRHSDSDNSDIIARMLEWFSAKVRALHLKGIGDIILDPGVGFNKSISENYKILNGLDRLKVFNCPVMVGISRKSMIYRALGITPDEALNGTTALHSVCLERGAAILRAHDVNEAKECVKLYSYLKRPELVEL